jgi:YVTN family beta-propeller protein
LRTAEGARCPTARSFALTLLCVLTIYPAVAKDTGLLFVSNEKTNNTIVIDPNAYKVINNIKVGRRPRDMHFDADHTKLYIACGDDGVIAILDVAALKIVGKLKTGSRPEAFAIDETRRRICVSRRRCPHSPSSTWIAARS